MKTPAPVNIYMYILLLRSTYIVFYKSLTVGRPLFLTTPALSVIWTAAEKLLCSYKVAVSMK